jgi:hypothetical protein
LSLDFVEYYDRVNENEPYVQYVVNLDPTETITVYTQFGSTMIEILIQIMSDLGGLFGSLSPIFALMIPIVSQGTFITETSSGVYVTPVKIGKDHKYRH